MIKYIQLLNVNHKGRMNILEIDDKYFKPIPKYKNNIEGWKNIKIMECGEELVPLSNINKRIIVNSQYYLRNIKGSDKECYLRKTVAEKLLQIIDKLPQNYALLIWDTYRTIEVQQSLFDEQYNSLKKENFHMTDEEIIEKTQEFVSLPSLNPDKPSPHNTGAVIDFTICDLNGNPINMGVEFDNFRDVSHTRYFEELLEKGMKLSSEDNEALMNRRLLYNISLEVGLQSYPYECWHKSYNDQMAIKLSGGKYATYGSYDLLKKESLYKN